MEIKTVIDKRQQILDAAMELFAENGFEATSTRMLTAQAGVNGAMINYYFGSKEKLFEALVEDRTSYMRERLQLLNKTEGDAFDKINTVIDLYLERILSNQKFQRILEREVSLQQRPELSENIANILTANAEEIIKIIKDGIRKKEFRAVDPEMTIFTLFGTISKVVQSTCFCEKVIGHGATVNMQDEPHRSRLKNHLKDLMRAHLTPRK